MHFTHTKKSLGFAILEIKLTCCNSLSLLEFRNRQLRIRINFTGWNIHGYIGTVERKCRASNCILCQLTISNQILRMLFFQGQFSKFFFFFFLFCQEVVGIFRMHNNKVIMNDTAAYYGN